MAILDLILRILAILVPLIVLFLGVKMNHKAKLKEIKFQEDLQARDTEQKNKQTERDILQENRMADLLKVFTERLQGIDKLVWELMAGQERTEKLIIEHTQKDTFSDEFAEQISNKANRIVSSSLNSEVMDVYKTIMLKWADYMQKYGELFYKNKKRNIDIDELTDELRQQIEKYINLFYKDLDLHVPDAKNMRFSELVKKAAIHRRTHALCERLIENNLENKDIVAIFKKYISDFFKLFLSCVDTWNLELNKRQ